MIIRYSARATRDLESIYEYLSQRSPQAALSVLAAIYAAVEFVRRHPEAAELININGIRMKVVIVIDSRSSMRRTIPRTLSKSFMCDTHHVVRGPEAMIRAPAASLSAGIA
jgi:plasmid stabilization system protein ParE